MTELSTEQKSWFREEFERAQRRNANLPSHARMAVTSPAISAHSRSESPAQEPVSAGGQTIGNSIMTTEQKSLTEAEFIRDWFGPGMSPMVQNALAVSMEKHVAARVAEAKAEWQAADDRDNAVLLERLSRTGGES